MTARAKRLIGFLGLLMILVIGLIIMTRFAHAQAKERLCEDLSINVIHPQAVFVEPEDLTTLLETSHLIPTGKRQHQAQSYQMEDLVRHQAIVENAEVYIYPSGNVEIQVDQRRPIISMYTQDGQRFYMDPEGAKIKPNKKYSDRLLICNGYINAHNAKQIQSIHQVAVFIDKDPFLKTLIDQIYVDQQNELHLIPAVGRQEITFGRAEDLELKFERLTYFYRYGVSKIGWDRYTNINVKFNNQVVCTK